MPNMLGQVIHAGKIVGYFEYEGSNSLFRVEPMDRLHVYAGCHEWTVEQAYNELRAI